MWKYKITYMCGHKGTIKMPLVCKEKNSKVEWISKNMVCPDCYRDEYHDPHDVRDVRYKCYKRAVEHGRILIPRDYAPLTKSIKVYQE